MDRAIVFWDPRLSPRTHRGKSGLWLREGLLALFQRQHSLEKVLKWRWCTSCWMATNLCSTHSNGGPTRSSNGRWYFPRFQRENKTGILYGKRRNIITENGLLPCWKRVTLRPLHFVGCSNRSWSQKFGTKRMPFQLEAPYWHLACSCSPFIPRPEKQPGARKHWKCGDSRWNYFTLLIVPARFEINTDYIT